jgi:hypothetical protein
MHRDNLKNCPTQQFANSIWLAHSRNSGLRFFTEDTRSSRALSITLNGHEASFNQQVSTSTGVLFRDGKLPNQGKS